MNITDRMTKLVLARKPETGVRGVKRLRRPGGSWEIAWQVSQKRAASIAQTPGAGPPFTRLGVAKCCQVWNLLKGRDVHSPATALGTGADKSAS